MAHIQDILESRYPHLPEVDTRVAALLSDALCWCRQNEVWTRDVLVKGWRRAWMLVSTRNLGFLYYLHDPKHKQLEAQYLAERAASGGDGELIADEEDSEDPEDREIEQGFADGAARFAALFAEVDGLARIRKDKNRAAAIVTLACCLLNDSERVARAVVAATETFGRCRSRPTCISEDQFYSREELEQFFGEKEIPQRIADFQGFPLKPDTLFSGVDVIAWIKSHRDECRS